MSRKSYVDGRESTVSVIRDNRRLGWTCERHATDCPLDGHLLRDKALELAGEYGVTGFTCPEKRLTSSLQKVLDSAPDLEVSSRPIFSNYRFWVDTTRAVITWYKCQDLFHLDELNMYLNVASTTIASMIRCAAERAKPNMVLRSATILLCRNVSDAVKLPFLIFDSYPVIIMNKDRVRAYIDVSMNVGLFKERLKRLNNRTLRNDWEVLLFLHRDRISVFREPELSNIGCVFFLDNFPPLLRPLKRDVLRFVKMIYRSKYVKAIKKHGRRRNVENAARDSVEAWGKVLRALVIASLGRTSHRTDDRFLKIYCDAWEDLRIGVPFGGYVAFDDDLPEEKANASREHGEFSDRNHIGDLRTRGTVSLVDGRLNFEVKVPTDKRYDRVQANGISKRTHMRMNVNQRKGGSLKRLYHEARLDEDFYERMINAKSNDNLTVGSNQTSENGILAPPSSKLPKIISVGTIDAAKRRNSATQNVKSEEIDSRQITTTSTILEIGTDRVCNPETAGYEKTIKDSRVLNNDPPIESPLVVGRANAKDASRQIFDDTSATVSDTGEINVGAISGIAPMNEVKSIDLTSVDGNHGHSSRRSLKRRRSRAVNHEESRSPPLNDDEPERKRSKLEPDRCEAAFVFGLSDVAHAVSTVFADALADDYAIFNGYNGPRSRSKRSRETEKSIFTIRPRQD